MDRQDVYELIDDERTFQEVKWKHRNILSVSDELLIMRRYINKAMDSYVGIVGEKVALDQIRKVIATGVRCLENHGVKEVVRR